MTRSDRRRRGRMMKRIGLIREGRQAFRETEAVWYALDRTTWERTRAAEPSTRG